jgi:predicted phage baseplate assembly protein
LDGSARAALHVDPRRALPAIQLQGPGGAWFPRYDLLDSAAFSAEFVVETEDDGSAWLRFGDDVHGQRPNSDERFTAEYRAGNGRIGNVGADALAHVVGVGFNIARVRNPLPATGGEDPETLDHVRAFAPQAFRTQQRAVTERDYADVAERDTSAVQHAQATFRWTGSWHTAFVTVDRVAGQPVDAPFATALRDRLEPFRMAGYDVEINAPRFVSLDIQVRVCVAPHYFRADVQESLLRELGAGTLPDGRHGLFHPDNFSLGQPLYLSQLYDAAMRVEGVASVDIVRFQRWGKVPNQELANGTIRAARLEILRLENDPNFPEHGRLELVMLGGL